MLGVLWMIGKILLILLAVLLGLLGLILLALILPVTIKLLYEKQEFRAWVSVLGLRFQIYPWPQKKKTSQQQNRAAAKKAKKQKAAEAKKKKAAAQQPLNAQLSKAPEKQAKLTAGALYSMVCAAGSALRFILSRLKIHQVRVRWPIYGGDAAQTAQKYGKSQAALHSALAVLRNVLDIRLDELALVPDFNGEKQGTELFSCKITANLLIMVIAGIRALIQLIQAGVL